MQGNDIKYPNSESGCSWPTRKEWIEASKTPMVRLGAVITAGLLGAMFAGAVAIKKNNDLASTQYEYQPDNLPGMLLVIRLSQN